jgi:hypothetical protein
MHHRTQRYYQRSVYLIMLSIMTYWNIFIALHDGTEWSNELNIYVYMIMVICFINIYISYNENDSDSNDNDNWKACTHLLLCVCVCVCVRVKMKKTENRRKKKKLQKWLKQLTNHDSINSNGNISYLSQSNQYYDMFLKFLFIFILFFLLACKHTTLFTYIMCRFLLYKGKQPILLANVKTLFIIVLISSC